MIKTFVRNKLSKQLHPFRKIIRNGIEELIYCALTFLFLVLLKFRGLRVTQNDTPKMVKKIPYALLIYHEILRNTLKEKIQHLPEDQQKYILELLKKS